MRPERWDANKTLNLLMIRSDATTTIKKGKAEGYGIIGGLLKYILQSSPILLGTNILGE